MILSVLAAVLFLLKYNLIFIVILMMLTYMGWTLVANKIRDFYLEAKTDYVYYLMITIGSIIALTNIAINNYKVFLDLKVILVVLLIQLYLFMIFTKATQKYKVAQRHKACFYRHYNTNDDCTLNCISCSKIAKVYPIELAIKKTSESEEVVSDKEKE